MMWMFIKTIIIITAFFWQLYIVFQTENLADVSGDYSQATYEMLWLILLFFIGESILKEDDK